MKLIKVIFFTKNIYENIGKLNNSFQENQLVKNVIDFITKDKKDLFVHHFHKMIGLIFGDTDFPEFLKN